jgi:RHS repeat-associated protein
MANANYNFSYDHRDRLTRAWTTSNGLTTADEGYAYDAIGNLTQKGSIASQYGSNLNGTGVGPHQVRQVGGQSVSYDANGNMLAGNSRTFTWNTQNQPTTITGLDGVTEVYNYNADGERVTRTRGNDTTVFFEGLWEEVLSSSNRYYYPFNGQMVAMRDNTIGGAVFWLHGDLLGSVTASSDGNGNVTRQVFGPWGQLRAGSSSISQTTLNYTGQRLDGTGLLYYHARYYDPALGRFISPDSVVPDYKDPQDLNRYSYVKNNPVRYNDPTGHCGKTTFAETAASVMTFDCTCRAWDALQKVKTPQDKALMATVTVLSAGGATAGWVGGTILGMQGAAALTGAVAMSAEASAATTGAVQLASANAVAGASGSTAAQLASGQDVDPTSVGVAALTSAATGGVAGYTRLASTPLGTTLLNGAAGAAQYQLDTALHGKQATTTDTLISAGIGAFGGAVGGPVTPRRFNVFPSVTAASRAFARSNFTKGTFTRTALTGIGTNYNWADLIYSGRGPR